MVFKAGESGNPNGRPRGIMDKRSRFRGLLEAHAEAIIERLVQSAQKGDPVALRLCVERLLPRPRPEGIDFPLPEGSIDSGENMLQITHAITQSVASGLMSVEEAQEFAMFLERQRSRIRDAERKKRDEEWHKGAIS